MPQLSAAQIVKTTGGEIHGDENKCIDSVAKLDEARPNDLAFFANPKYESQVYTSKCGVLFVPASFNPSQPLDATYIKHENPYFAFCMVLSAYFNPNQRKSGIHETAVIHPSAVIGENVYIGPYVHIDEHVRIGNNAQIHERVSIGTGTQIGDDALLFPGVTIYSKTLIGHHFTAHAGSIIGSDGFGFAPVNGKYEKIPQVGIVRIEDNVELGANCCIDRATMGETLIKEGTKLDNLVQIAHNVEIGEHTVMASQCGVAGSAKIGHHSVFGGQAGIAGHITIDPNNSFGGQAGITSSVKGNNRKMTGTPAMDVNAYLRGVAGSQKVSQLLREIQLLKKEIESLKKHNEQ